MALAVAGVAVAAVLGACTSVRTNLGTESSNCYLTLPTAVGAVHGQGHLVGMRLINTSALVKPVPALGTPPGRAATQVCLVAFGGRFAAADVERPVGSPEGSVAVVETSYPAARVVATWLGPPHAGARRAQLPRRALSGAA